jgi:hypothetical protein
MKIEAFDLREIKTLMEEAIQYWKEHGRVKTEVSYELTSDGVVKIELHGASGMQLLGLAEVILHWIRTNGDNDPMECAIIIGQIARLISEAEGNMISEENKLTIKFNEEAEHGQD